MLLYGLICTMFAIFRCPGLREHGDNLPKALISKRQAVWMAAGLAVRRFSFTRDIFEGDIWVEIQSTLNPTTWTLLIRVSSELSPNPFSSKKC